MGIINVLYSLHPDKRRPTIDRYTNMIVKFEIVLHMDAAVQGFVVKHAKLSCFHILEPSLRFCCETYETCIFSHFGAKLLVCYWILNSKIAILNPL